MGLFDRIRSGIKGAAEGVVGGLERSNPAAVFEAAIATRTAHIAELRSRAAGVAAQRDDAVAKAEAIAAELKTVQTALHAAVAEGDDETGLVLQMRLIELRESLEARTATAAALAEEARSSVDDVATVKAEVAALKRDRERALADLAVAEARIDMQESASGLSDDPSAKALDTVRSSIARLEGEAHEGYLDADGNSVRGRAAALGEKAKAASAQAQLAALKRQLGRTDDDED